MGRIRFTKKSILMIAACAAVILICGAVVLIARNAGYQGYRVVAEHETLSDGSARYVSLHGRILRCSGDGVSLIGDELEPQWSDALALQSPVVKSAGDVALIYEKNGMQAALFNAAGRISSFRTDEPILSASVSGNGSVLAIVDKNGIPVVRYFSSAGELIADVAGDENEDGYPVDADVSPDGSVVCVSFLRANEEGVGGKIAIYRFGSGAEDDPLLYSEPFEGEIIPDVVCADGRCVVLGEKGFTVYRTAENVTKEKSVVLDGTIASAFYDSTRIGFILNGSGDGKRYRIELYDLSGKKTGENGTDMIYTGAVMEEGRVLLYNDTELALYTGSGRCRFSGVVSDGGISQAVGISRKRILLSGTTKTKIIELKLLDSQKDE